MKTYFPIFAVFLLFSSCIKVENTNLCSNTPQTPQLAYGSYLVAPGGTLNLNITNANPSYTYKWLNPVGSPFTGANLVHYDANPTDYGLWSVFAQNGFACESDTLTFYVGQGTGSCGIGKDTFSIAGMVYPVVSQPATIDNYGNYQMNFSGGGVTGNILFPSQPTYSSAYTVVNNQGGGNLYSGSCSISLNYGTYYSSNSGTASVLVNGSVITVTFCDVQFTNYVNLTNVYGNGYLTGS